MSEGVLVILRLHIEKEMHQTKKRAEALLVLEKSNTDKIVWLNNTRVDKVLFYKKPIFGLEL